VATTFSPAHTRAERPLVVAAFAAGAVWLVAVLVWSDAPFALTFDDAWYYAEIGRNLAHGHGSTFDTLNATNGYHPLWQVVTTLPHLVGLDGLAAMRAVLAFQLGLWAAAVVLLVRRVERPSPTLAVAVALVAANPFVLRTVASGLESGLVVLVGALLLTHVEDLDADDRLANRRFGALLALAVLARTDAILLVGVVALWVLPDVRRLHRVVAAPVVTFAVYSLANRAAFGRLTQVSGDVKRVDLTTTRALGAMAVAGVAVLLAHRLRRLTVSERFPRLTAFLSATGWYAAFCVGLVGYYTLLSAQLWLWYFAPLVLYGLALLLHGGADLLDGAAAEGTRSLRTVQALLLVPLLGGLVLQARTFADPHLRSIQEANRDAGRWISAHLPDDAVIGSWDAGVLGYFTDQPVVNLDGVVNSDEFADALHAGTAGALLRAEGVTHIANHGGVVDGDDPLARALVDHLFGPGTGDAMELVHVLPFLYSGTSTRGGSGLQHFAVFVYELDLRSTP
jgi:hypothetical protein